MTPQMLGIAAIGFVLLGLSTYFVVTGLFKPKEPKIEYVTTDPNTSIKEPSASVRK